MTACLRFVPARSGMAGRGARDSGGDPSGGMIVTGASAELESRVLGKGAVLWAMTASFELAFEVACRRDLGMRARPNGRAFVDGEGEGEDGAIGACPDEVEEGGDKGVIGATGCCSIEFVSEERPDA